MNPIDLNLEPPILAVSNAPTFFLFSAARFLLHSCIYNRPRDFALMLIVLLLWYPKEGTSLLGCIWKTIIELTDGIFPLNRINNEILRRIQQIQQKKCNDSL